MIRRFLWLYLIVILPTTASSMGLIWYIDNVFMHQVFLDSVRALDRQRFGKIITTLNETPRERWPQRMAEIAKVYPFAIEYKHLDAVDLNGAGPEERAFLDRGDVALTWAMPYNSIALQRVPGSDVVLVLNAPVVGRTHWWVYAIVLLLPSLVAFVTLFVWFRPFWKDVKDITAVADDIGHGNFDVRTHMSRFSTLASVGEAIDRMADEIRQLLQNASDLSLAVAHDLKTPITQLSLAVELLRDNATPAVRLQAEGMMRDLAELDASVSEMLAAAQLERTQPFFPERIELKDFLAATVEVARAETTAFGSPATQVELGVIPAGVAYFDPRQMRRAVLNLARNAARHARSLVRVSGTIGQNTSTIIVEDDGPGIPAEHRARMFEPFMRGENARQRDTKGYGLGLAIVQRIARLHGGSAEIHDAADGGARVVIRW